MSLALDALLPEQVTAATAADSTDRRADYRLMAAVRPAVSRYCRARLGSGDRADEVARAVARTVAASPPDSADAAALTAFVYRTAAAAVDAVTDVGPPGMPAQLALLPPAQREVLVLRVAVGLSVEQTGAALDATPDVVRRVQHQALQRLRAAA